ncbi:Peptidoglycan-binding (PGRP) domain of peptidoglycan hydrolases-containing protein [Pseudobutyrivibrio sp. UC1225]|uniref:glycoside hydrolase domain-containing protein n=1 Tax=Pseudobutyrivibrio sp. UC1225 TaxID=1798185 RepID=UPI0008F304E5|nr:glycoside hydrolase domain-containing protein [Pseudobutyrivibrio sp. UC1225]SFO03883.1 Peptidoglycan-binding (PGRP) domain of peptidoglycan hydrolases-containing protein [Pseudobutyrivibrio sp. UC1225]
MDLMVKKTQEWLNTTYGNNPDFVKVTEDGKTGNGTVKGLIRALQIELGATVDGSLGTKTLEKFGTLTRGCNKTSASKKRQVYILQGGLYCKGYNPNGLDGGYGAGVEAAVKKLKADAGLSNPNGNADAAFMKALLTTDGYVLAKNGDAQVRTIQQSLNRDYSSLIGLIPCDGIFVKQTLRALIKGLQYEIKKEWPEIVVDGIWGTNTAEHCPIMRKGGVVHNAKYVFFLQYALYINGFTTGNFNGIYSDKVETAVKNFQKFSNIITTGIANRQTWASLMVSYGDKSRKGKACDCMTPISKATAISLVNDGREVVGRYIVGGSNKILTLDEERIIYKAGLKIMPIFQNTNNTSSYFTKEQALKDASKAYINLCKLKFPNGTTFYVAVDYDVNEKDVANVIIPYFRTFWEQFKSLNNRDYKIGVYGPRYVCTELTRANLVTSSFVCDMSSGFAGNIGKPLPANWAYDQISTVKIGSGAGLIEIDNNIMSGKNSGAVVNPDAHFELTESEKEECIKSTANTIIRKFKLRELTNAEYTFEKEILLASTINADVYIKITNSVASNKSAVYSVGVTNRKFTNPDFSVEIANVKATLKNVDKSLIPDLDGLASEIGNGRVEISISAEGTNTILEIKSVVLSTENDILKKDFAVIVKIVFKNDSPRPVSVMQEVWDGVFENLKKVREPQLSYNEKIVCLIYVVVVFFFILLCAA